jgi:leucyl aminopeptidase
MKNRYYRSESGAAASVRLRDKWRSFTTRSDVTVELFDQGYEQKSVILTIPGTTRKNEIVVIGGHLDSIALGGVNSNAPGADDDASGIATLTEVARVLLAKDFRPTRTIKFMAYAAEEVGLRGSQAIVRDFKKRKIIGDVVGALQLDMTNYRGSDRDIWLMSDYTSAAQNTFLSKLIEAYVGATWGVDKCGYACSDHASWNRAGVPASMPFEARMRDGNGKIHSARDTLEMSDNNAAHAVKFARLGAAYAIELAKGDLGGEPLPRPEDHSSWLALLANLVMVAASLRFARVI